MNPDPGGPKTCGSGAGFGSGSETLIMAMYKSVNRDEFLPNLYSNLKSINSNLKSQKTVHIKIR
jgi:hypothetical protein